MRRGSPQNIMALFARRARIGLALVLIWMSALQPLMRVQAGVIIQDDPSTKARNLLAKLTPEEKVGQLFLITFTGQDLASSTAIYDLIINHFIGGVVLSSANDNFSGPDNTVNKAYQLTSSLQSLAFQKSQLDQVDPISRSPYTPQYIPLFIGVAQEGDGYPNDQIFNGLTPLPNPMAVGATWDVSLAQQVGSVLGKELEATGFNLLLGPSLDVLEVMPSDGAAELGTRTFGGDPFWVGEMGKNYISGVHEGSGGRIAVMAKHFPGSGGSDRPPGEEVSTVRKSLEQLKQIELAPFFSVTGNAPSADAAADGLLVSHIRYQGLAGNIRATTKPVSLDQTALEQLMALPEFSKWRQNGGLVVSDDLGSQAVHRFYSPAGENFAAHQVARDAFLSGNDLLYINNMVSTGDPDSYTSLLRTLEFFSQKYREDSVFSQRVDLSVERLLTLKYALYPNFTTDEVTPPEANLSDLGQSEDVTFRVAQKAATLLSPDLSELSVIVPRSPTSQERMVFITDTIEGRQCSSCAVQKMMPVDGLQNTILNLYGPGSGDQIYNYNLKSFSFIDLNNYLTGQTLTEEVQTIGEDIRSANWLVFSIGSLQTSRPESWALRKLLANRPDLIRDKKVIVFAFSSPYYLDATDISKLTAYYGMYSKTQPFIDMAARLLFQEFSTSGALPVSVSGVGYDLITATSPDPNQLIPLTLDIGTPPDAAVTPTPESTVEPTAVPRFSVGDSIPLRTGVILDHNKNRVPDGTVVRFFFTTGGEEGGTVQQIDTVTTAGVARASFRIQSAGLLEIRVTSEPAIASEILRLDVSRGEAAAITAIAPTLGPTETEMPTMTPTLTPTVATPTPEPVKTNTTGRAFSWLISMLIVWGIAVGAYWIIRVQLTQRWAIRFGLLTASGGLLAYFLFSLIARPIQDGVVDEIGMFGLAISSAAGCVAGMAAGWAWRWWLDKQVNKSKTLKKVS